MQSSQCSGDCHQRQLCTTSERMCISPATPVLMMMDTLMTMIMNMIMMMMMTMKTMEIVIKAYVYFPSDSCTNGLCRSQTRGVISLEGASSHIKYNCLSNKYIISASCVEKVKQLSRYKFEQMHYPLLL